MRARRSPSSARPAIRGAPGSGATAGRSLWFRVHRWLGLFVGLWFALVGLTGAILVYEEPIDAWLNPHLLVTAQRGALLTPGAIMARAEAEQLAPVERLRVPRAAGETYRLLVRSHPTRRTGNPRLEAFFDPVTGDLLGTRSAERLSLAPPYALQTIYEFHRNILLGEPGSNLVGVAGTLLLVGALSGLVLAWPRGRAAWARLLAINWRASVTRIAFDLHRAAGAIVALLLVLVTLTGITLVWTGHVRDLVNVFSRVESFPTIPWRTVQRTEPAPLDEQLAAVRAAFPARAITEVRMPTGQLSGTQVYLHAPGDEYRLGDTIVWVHPVTAELLVERSDRTRTAGETVMHWLFPLHSGTAFGSAGMAAMGLAGLAPALLVGTGLWVWLRKRRGERIAQQRRADRAAAPPPRSAAGTAGPTAAAGRAKPAGPSSGPSSGPALGPSSAPESAPESAPSSGPSS